MYFVTVYANGVIVVKAGMQKRKRRPEKGGVCCFVEWRQFLPGFQLDSALRA